MRRIVDRKGFAHGTLVEVKVPDIGDFKDIPVIEVLVKPGDTVKAEDALVTLESDKATMDVPSPVDGVVKEMKVKVGDKVSEGIAAAHVERSRGRGARRNRRTAKAAAPASPRPAPRAEAGAPQRRRRPPTPAAAAGRARADRGVVCRHAPTSNARCSCWAPGPGGYSAAFRSADLGMKTVLVERYATLGGVCLNVGCIPSKALLHTASVMDEVKDMGAHGISFGAPQIDLDKLRGFKDGVVKKLTGGLAGMAKARKVEVVRGVGRFLDPHHLEVELTTGTGQDKTGAKKIVKFAEGDHRRRQSGGEAAVHSGGSARRRFDRRAASSKAIPKRMLVDRRRHHRPRNGHRLLDARHAHRRRRDARRHDGRRRSRPRQGVGKEECAALRQRHAEDQDGVRRSDGRGHQGRLRGREGAGGAAGLRPRAGRRRPQPQRQADRRGQGRRRGHRPRLHSRRQADAHQRRAHLRDRRHRRPADARAQGGARGARRGRGRARARSRTSMRGRFRRSPTPIRKSPGPASPRSSARRRASSTARRCSRGPRRAARLPTAATKASPSCCSTRRRTAASAAASSARTPAT